MAVATGPAGAHVIVGRVFRDVELVGELQVVDAAAGRVGAQREVEAHGALEGRVALEELEDRAHAQAARRFLRKQRKQK